MAIKFFIITSFCCIFLVSCREKEATLPKVKTVIVTEISKRAAVTGGIILDNGNDKIIAKGVVCSTKYPSWSVTTTDGEGSEDFTSNLTGLTANTKYVVQAYATNGSGTAYGESLTFSTLPAAIPEVVTSEVSKITRISAICGGAIISDNGDSVFSKGLCWNTMPGPTIENNIMTSPDQNEFTLTIKYLSENTTYYIRAFAKNSAGIGYGEEKSFTTPVLPTITTLAVVTGTGLNTYSGGGTVTNDGGSPVLEGGFCWGRSRNPTINDFKTADGTGSGTFTSTIILTDSVMVYGRAYVMTEAGIAYGEEVFFGADQKIVKDIDGNVYHVIRIGTQLWLKENLKTTRYNNGGSLLNGHTTDYSSTWDVGYYYNYNDDESLVPLYGRLYNNRAAINPSIAPTGWRVPSLDDVKTLFYFLGDYNLGGGPSAAGGALKETGTSHWLSPNTAADNSTDFTALPGGYIQTDNKFYSLGEYGIWWTTTRQTGWDMAAYYHFSLRHDSQSVSIGWVQIGAGPGFSIRCVK